MNHLCREIYAWCLLGLVATGCTARAAAMLPDDPAGREMVKTAQRAIAAYREGQPRTEGKLRVVYFHPNDRDPLPDYAERLERVMTDISDFYRDGLRRFGFESNGLPLERRDGRLVLHVVRGKSAASAYTHEDGNRPRAEIRAALKDVFDLDREHVLVIYGLCRKEPDGRYVFDAPYYGGGSQRAGLAHAADCELLDPLLLPEAKKKIVYTEHYYPRVEQTVARFNSWYIGGIAHELGHGLGLDHDAGSVEEKRFGTSLMGGGNHTYRQEVWGGGAPTYLSRASALQLASHPLFTQSNRGRWDAIGAGIASLKFSVEDRALCIDGTITDEVAPYAVVAHVWPTSAKTDHGAISFPAGVEAGAFTLRLGGLRPDTYHVRLVTLHVNGGTTSRELRLTFDASGKPDVATLSHAWMVDRAENAVLRRDAGARALLTDEVIAHAPTPEAARKLRALRAVVEPVPPVELASVTGRAVFLSDAAWTEAKVGWGQVARNHYWFDAPEQNAAFLLLRSELFEKGLYAHSPARYGFALDTKWKTFTAIIGLRDGAHQQGSAVFVVRGDGRELYRSPILRPGAVEKVNVSVAGVKQLELLTDGGEGHAHNSWAIWAEPRVER